MEDPTRAVARFPEDRELLELAAKAAGYENPIYGELSGDGPVLYLQTIGLWDPIGDDGDALRLAVKLGLNLYLSDCGYVQVDGTDTLTEDFGVGDPYAATRRIIVRAAAEIGRSLAPAVPI